jgi:hypothetical protein
MSMFGLYRKPSDKKWKFILLICLLLLTLMIPRESLAQVYTYLNTSETATSLHAIATCVTHAMNNQHKAWSQVRITSPSGRVVTVNTGNPSSSTYWPYVTATATADLPLLFEDGTYSVLSTAEQYCYVSKQITTIPGQNDSPIIIPFLSLMEISFIPTHLKKSSGSSTLKARVMVSQHYNGTFELNSSEAGHSGIDPEVNYHFEPRFQTITQQPATSIEYVIGYLTTFESNNTSGIVIGAAVLQGYSGTTTKVGTLNTKPYDNPGTGAIVDLN